MNSQYIADLIADANEQSPGALALARVLSFAALADPVLLRRARLELLPDVEAGAEADLWFSSLVQTRSTRGLVIFREVAETFRSELSEADAHRAWSLTEAAHSGYPDAITVEEKLNWLSLHPEKNAEEIRDLLRSVIASIVHGSRPELAYWAAGALGRLPDTMRTEVEARILGFASDVQQGQLWRIREALSGETRFPDWIFQLMPRTLPQVALGVRLTRLGIEFGPAGQESSLSLSVPDTDPRVLQLTWGTRERINQQLLFIRPGDRTLPLPIGESSLEVVTLAADQYLITQQAARAENAVSPALGSGAFIRATSGSYAAVIAWRYPEKIDTCVGFVVERRDETEQEKVVAGTFDAETTGRDPVQRFLWIDSGVRPGSSVSYRVTPVLANEISGGYSVMKDASSGWSIPVRVGRMATGDVRAVFNRGVGRFTPPAKARAWIAEASPTSQARRQAGGDLRFELLGMLLRVAERRGYVYAALHHLDDSELIEALVRLEGRAQVILGREKNRRSLEANAEVATVLSKSGVKVLERGASGHLLHSRFMVVTSADHNPYAVWTGTADWTTQHICLAPNTGLVLENRELASLYLEQWKRMFAAGNKYSHAASSQRTVQAGNARVTVCFGPGDPEMALDKVYRSLAQAQESAQFVGFHLAHLGVIDQIRKRAGQIYVRGVVSTAAGTVHLIEHEEQRETRELRAGVDMARPHERFIVIDAMGRHPIVITGSSVFSYPALSKNDEDLLIIEDATELATQFAVRFATIYQHYRFLIQARTTKALLRLDPTDRWQERFLRPDAVQEQNFWLGSHSERAVSSAPVQRLELPKQEPEVNKVSDGAAALLKSSEKKTKKKSSARRTAVKNTSSVRTRTKRREKVSASKSRRTAPNRSASKTKRPYSSRSIHTAKAKPTKKR